MPAVVRFGRFFITSVTGLVAGLLSPFGAFMRTPTLRAIGGTLLVSFLAFIYLTLTAMQAPVYVAPPTVRSASQAEAPVEPSMKKMLNDIYGDAY